MRTATLLLAVGVARATLVLELTTDNHPEDTTWTLEALDGPNWNQWCSDALLNSAGGPYDEANHIYEETITTFDLCPGVQYEFVIRDVSGNSLGTGYVTGDDYEGMYRLMLDGVEIGGGGGFQNTDTIVFDKSVAACATCDQAQLTM